MSVNSNFFYKITSNILSTVNNYLYQNDSFNYLIEKIKSHIANCNYICLLEDLNQLCGSNGHANIEIYNDNHQIYLFFDSNQKREEVSTHLIEKFKIFSLPPANLSFDNWQKQDTESSFCLKLSTNQSAALLGFNPLSNQDFLKSQKLLKEMKKRILSLSDTSLIRIPNDAHMSDTSLNMIPDEVILKILLTANNLEVLGRIAQINTHFLSLIDTNDSLWQTIARIQQIVPDNIDFSSFNKKQVEQAVAVYNNAINNAILDLKESRRDFDFSQLKGLSAESIKDLGGICLVKINNSLDIFHGTALGYNKELQEHVLVLVELQALQELEDFTQIMRETVKKLYELKIIPKSFNISTCRGGMIRINMQTAGGTHPVLKRFENWQATQKKI